MDSVVDLRALDSETFKVGKSIELIEVFEKSIELIEVFEMLPSSSWEISGLSQTKSLL